MAAQPPALVSEQEYLHTQYKPDCGFEDGVLIERHVGTEKHGWLQAALAAYFFRRRKAWNLNVYTLQKHQRPTPGNVPESSYKGRNCSGGSRLLDELKAKGRCPALQE
jgi:hypothetical protein